VTFGPVGFTRSLALAAITSGHSGSRASPAFPSFFRHPQPKAFAAGSALNLCFLVDSYLLFFSSFFALSMLSWFRFRAARGDYDWRAIVAIGDLHAP